MRLTGATGDGDATLFLSSLPGKPTQVELGVSVLHHTKLWDF
jgi:hypothetical protein